MDIISILLGAVQGLTEFLPISSSGHLNLVSFLFGKELSLVFEVILHLATLIAVCVYSFPLIKSMCFTLFRYSVARSSLSSRTEGRRIEDVHNLKLVYALVLSTLATAPIGIMLKDSLEGIDIHFVGMGFLATSFVLIIPFLIPSKRRNIHRSLEHSKVEEVPNISSVQAIVLGLVQGLAIFPGISRSGTTISVAVLMGLHYLHATRYSFLMAIPAIIASFVFSIPSLSLFTQSISFPSLVMSIVLCFVIALFSLRWLTFISRKGKMWVFSIYLFPLGLYVLFVL